MRLSRIFLIAVAILIPIHAFSQGSLLKKGESGFGLLGGGAFNTEAIAIQGSFVVTAIGLVDLGGAIGSQLGNGENSATSTTALLGELYILRQDRSKNIPLTISAFTQYSGISSRHFLFLGMSFYVRTGESKHKFVQPFFSIAKMNEVDRARSSTAAVAMGISIGKNIGQSSVLSFTPSLSIAQKELSGTLTLGLTFPVPSREKASDPRFDF